MKLTDWPSILAAQTGPIADPAATTPTSTGLPSASQAKPSPTSVALHPELRAILQAALQQQKLPAAYLSQLESHLIPCAQLIAAWYEQKQRHSQTPLIVGLCGAQGSGKSTSVEFLKLILNQGLGLRAMGFSIDDIYLSHAQRQQLSQAVHPLLATRGVPGTHDLELGLNCIDQLCNANEGSQTAIPSFDKAQDDRRSTDQWPCYQGRPDIVLFEGWCVGAMHQKDTALDPAMNDLETQEDPQAVWRKHVNQQLESQYPRLFKRLDRLILLKIPDFNLVYQWRARQEKKLAEKLLQESANAESSNTANNALNKQASVSETENNSLESQNKSQNKLMDRAQLQRFIMHYERLTRWILQEMPERADLVLELTEHQQISHPRLNLKT